MEYFLLLVIVFVIIAVALKAYEFFNPKKVPDTSTGYSYVSKNSVMTSSEEKLFRQLVDLFGADYYIFPQIHLSALFSSKSTSGNAWSGFLKVNQKSVDFVLCDINTLKPVCAIELDDWSHSKQKRIARDAEVEKIFAEASLRLIRIKDINNLDIEQLKQVLISLKPNSEA